MLGSQRGSDTPVHAITPISFTVESHEKNVPSRREWLLFILGLEAWTTSPLFLDFSFF